MAKILGRHTTRISLPGAASLLVITMLFAQALGFLRTKLVNANFPLTGPESTDVYFASFKIPDFFFYVLAAGVLSGVLIPILSERMAKSDRRGVWVAEIELDANAEQIDFFSNYLSRVKHNGRAYETYLSSPYTRVVLPKR